MRRLHRQPAQGLVGRRGHRRQRLLLRLPAAARRRPLAPTTTVLGHARRQGARATSCSARTRPSARPTPGCSAWRMAKLDWLVVRDLVEIETATFWQRRARDRDRRAAHRGHRHRGVLPARRRAHREGRHASPTPSGCCSGTTRRSSRRATAAQRPVVHVPPRPASSGRSWPARPTRRTARCSTYLGLPDRGRRTTSPSADAVLREINGCGAGRPAAVGLHRAARPTARPRAAAGSTAACYADEVNQAARRKPGAASRRWVAPEWGWAWPANRRILYNRASADPDGQAVVGAQDATSGGTRSRASGPGDDVPDFEADQAARLPARPTARAAEDALARRRPVHHAGRRQGLAVRARRARRRAAARPTTSRRSRRSTTRCTRQQREPGARSCIERPGQPLPPAPASRADVTRTWSPPTGSPSTTPRAG